mmetsp:Transcript_245/g.458  ORF Transcript_245/g.458 Transcript_245/m.458 type:complete len:391 (-) Transcript_245:267-1439(-)
MMHLLLRFLIVDLSVSMSKVMFTSFRLTLGVGECVGVSTKTKFFFLYFFSLSSSFLSSSLFLGFVSFLLLLATRGWQSNGHLEGVVDTPLQSCEGTDHHNTKWKSSSEQANHAHLVDDLSHGSTLGGVQLGHQVVGWVGNDGAEHTSDVTGHETDTQLLGLRALLLRLWHDILVQSLDSVLEAGELHHSVRDLSPPKRSETLVEAAVSFVSNKLWESIAESLGETRDSLNLHLDSLEWAKKNVGEELSTCTTSQEDHGLVSLFLLWSNHVSVVLFEKLVQSELSGSLGRVSKQGWDPSSDETGEALLLGDDTETGHDALVFLRISLHVTLDDVERGDHGMGKSTGQDSTDRACSIVRRRVELNAALGSGWNSDSRQGSEPELVPQRTFVR